MAKDDCDFNNTRWHNQKKVECLFGGERIGYELYGDGVRLGYFPKLSYADAKEDCKSWVANNSGRKVQCTYNGKPIGYELFWRGKRVGYRPEWTQNQGQNNCDWNVNRYTDRVVDCLYEGVVISPDG